MVSPPSPASVGGAVGATKATLRRRAGQLLACGWCGGPITVARVGRTPSWCSATCRHRAWETRRAAAAGDLPVRVVDRIVEVERHVPAVEPVEVPTLPRGARWAPALHELARQIDSGKVYERDLAGLAVGLTAVLDALTRRQGSRPRR